MCVCVCVCVYSCEAGNPLLVKRKYVLIVHKYFELSSSYFFLSDVPK